jgi:hypothetical protein
MKVQDLIAPLRGVPESEVVSFISGMIVSTNQLC